MNGYIGEIFKSLDGEVNGFGQGLISTFIRMTGCQLRCAYCDTQFAQEQEEDQLQSIEEVLDNPLVMDAKKITITGGEPLLQKDFLYELITNLIKGGKIVSVETNGSIEIPPYFKLNGVSWVIDFKFDYEDKMVMRNFTDAGKIDWIKFVITKKADFETAWHYIRHWLNSAHTRTNVAFSPVFIGQQPQDLDWLISKVKSLPVYPGLNIGVNIQLHKLLNFK